MLNIVCVLKSGGDFGPEDYKRLRNSLLETQGHGYFYCLIAITDMKLEREYQSEHVLPLQHDLPGWWSKMEAFGITGPTLFLDLDTVIVGDIEPLAYSICHESNGRFMMLRRWKKEGWGSGIMGWNGDWSWMLREFLTEEKHFMCRRTWEMVGGRDSYRGDQDWISTVIERRKNTEIVAAQDFCPGIYSYKHHVRGKGIPKDARIIYFHGRPRPAEVVPLT